MGRNKSINFKTYEEAGEWFDTHDMTDYEGQLKEVEFHFDLRKNRNWFELEQKIGRTIRELAKKQNISSRKLVNELLKEKLENLGHF
ncbi:CopG family antitoxin [Desulfococcaceae bacterium HSG8]|nr:CopG family antitoxin [Desulfococcaceae bacterium HSG8]